jgi:hypothetical protein
VINKTTLLLSAVTSLLLPAAARAGITGGMPSSCVGTTAAHAAKLSFDYFGVYNTDNAAHDFSCGVVRLSSSSPRSLFILYTDMSGVARVTCFVAVNAWDGTRVWSQTQQTGVADYLISGMFTFNMPSSAVGYVVAQCTVPPVYGSYTPSSITALSLQ